MNSTNMLSANKVKQHGMTSTKWTTKDKITQYKGLINLYTRDKAIIELDNAVAKKRQVKELKNLQIQIDEGRKKLDNAIRGDKQKLRNTLANHRKLQLTFQNSAPQKVIDTVHQVNFTKRKKRDMLRYKMKLKSEKLIDLKLKCSFFEDRLKYEGLQPMLPSEKKAHIITGKVQDAILKKEAAIYIRNSYKEMIAIMQKDAIYFDAILVSLKNDSLIQGKCMINATKLGQLGTEYLDDRIQDFQFLERIVKNDMVSRKRDLAIVQQNVENFAQNVKNLIRKDSDINLGKTIIEDSNSYTLFKNEIETVEDTLNTLKHALCTPSVDQLYPFLREQLRQKERLSNLSRKYEESRNILLNNRKQATHLLSNLVNSMVETTSTYTANKATFAVKIEEQNAKKTKYQILIDSRYKLLAKVRISLKHFQYLTNLLSNGSYRDICHKRDSHMPPLKPVEEEANIINIIPELTEQFARLANNSKELLTGQSMTQGYMLFQSLMRDRSKPIEIDKVVSEESLIETVFNDARVPTREDIKLQSDEIVARGLAEQVYKPPPPPKKKFKFKK